MKTSFQKVSFSAMLLIAFFAFSSCMNESAKDSKAVAEDQNKDKFDSKAGENSAQFVVDAVSGNYYEIRVARFAEQKSTNAEVKMIAKQLVADHAAMLNDLKSLASQKSISIPNEDSTEAAKEIRDLNDKKMSDFDKAWTDEMIDKHKATVSKFENAEKDLTDADIKAWIDGALPKVRSHLDMLNQCKDKLQ